MEVTLVRAGATVDLSITGAGCKVLRHELGVDAGKGGERLAEALPGWLGESVARSVRAFPADAVEAPASSGTSRTGGVILCPCSMGTLSRVSVGFSSNLVERAADVALKERRRLARGSARDAPLGDSPGEHAPASLGSVRSSCPRCRASTTRPSTIDDLVDHVVGKILDVLGAGERRVGARWKGLQRAGGGDRGAQALSGAPNDGD